MWEVAFWGVSGHRKVSLQYPLCFNSALPPTLLILRAPQWEHAMFKVETRVFGKPLVTPQGKPAARYLSSLCSVSGNMLSHIFFCW